MEYSMDETNSDDFIAELYRIAGINNKEKTMIEFTGRPKTNEETIERLAKQLEEYNKKKEGK